MNFWRRYRGELEAARNLRLIHHATVLRLGSATLRAAPWHWRPSPRLPPAAASR